MKGRQIKVALVLLALLGGWLIAPRVAVWSIVFATKKGEDSSKAAQDRIVFFGERAIQPTIASIEENSPWTRRYCYLPGALKRIGGSAHAQLLAAIDQQDDPQKRGYLISALQNAFQDFSQLTTIINDLEEGRIQSAVFFDISQHFPDAPKFLTEEGKLNPAFTVYWAQSNSGRSE